MAELSPMMKQYMAIKKQHQDQLLFFRLGDFYEMFFDDAKLASKELELTLTGRDCGQKERAPMCGVPYHSCDGYIAKLVAKGYKVAICEQTEDPALAKGIVTREVTRIITPGTVIEGDMLDESKNNYICAVCLDGEKAGLLFADVSTGDAYATELASHPIGLSVINELGRFSPSEVLLNPAAAADKSIVSYLKDRLGCVYSSLSDHDFDLQNGADTVARRFSENPSVAASVSKSTAVVRSVGALFSYLLETQKKGLERISRINFYLDDHYMNLDMTARRNLELCETMRNKEKKGTLLWVVDKTKTAMGKRLIRNYVEQPLLSIQSIVRRQDAVEELVNNHIVRSELAQALSGVYDLERIMTKVLYGSASPRDVQGLGYTCEALPRIKECVSSCSCEYLSDIAKEIDTLGDIHDAIVNALAPQLPAIMRNGGYIRRGYNAQLDELRDILENGAGVIASIEAREKERTGIRTLKVSYNKVFGYYIEVSNSFVDMVPEDYIRKQTLTNGERYITQELKELENKILTASERSKALESALFDELRKMITAQLLRVQTTASNIAKLDVICSFANVSAAGGYVRPEMTVSGEIKIENGRHPVVESLLDSPFVPNDTLLDDEDNRVAIITGPNMAGKSTYMRQVAIIVLMAQMGCFVPAKSAVISVVDGIFTRVGASDDLASGQSTFMVEMNEVAHILKNATSKSLIIFDEIGRGTSTFDGMSIARAVVEHIADKKKLGAKTLFATHYHELTALEGEVDGVNNYNIAVKKRGDDITFLRRIVRGGSDRSYGIEVAKLAGLSESIIRRSKDILAALESGNAPVAPKSALPPEIDEPDQLVMSFDSELKERLRSTDLNTLTPIEAMNLLYELKKMCD